MGGQQRFLGLVVVLVMIGGFSLSLQKTASGGRKPPDPASPSGGLRPPLALPGTKPLTMKGDITSELVSAAHKFLLRETEKSVDGRARYWQRDFTSAEKYNQSIEPNRKRLAHIFGVRDARVGFDSPELVATLREPALVGKGQDYEILAVRWPAFGDVFGEGLLLNPANGKPLANVVAVPDVGHTPEQLAGLVPGIPAESQYARRLAESGCRVLVPVLVDRQRRKSRRPGHGPWLTSREFLYRPAFELGRHILGYEIQKILAGVDWFTRDPALTRPKVGVIGWGEGGLLALYAGALDSRIDAVCVSGYFDDRRNLWQEPVDRNVFGLLKEFGDAELASMVAPRALIVEVARGPEITIPGQGGAPGRLVSPKLDVVRKEVGRARKLVEQLKPTPRMDLIVSGDGGGPFGSPRALGGFLLALLPKSKLAELGKAPQAKRTQWDFDLRQDRQIYQLDRHNQELLGRSPYERQKFMAKLDTATLDGYRRSVEPYREHFAREVVGVFEHKLLPPNARTRKIEESDKWTRYEVVMDVFDEVFAYGILTVPKGIPSGERRPVVVCQHGLEGRPQDVIGKSGYKSYKAFATQLAERGFVTFAPQNLYNFGDRFRALQRLANPLKATLFSIMVAQHQQITDWLKTLPFVDPARIAFYGLSYGGKSAMRIPPLVSNYCLSICSADFNDWVWKNASTLSPYSYVWTNEYEIFEFDLGSTFNYAEMAALIAPRPFMVERGHFDGVAPDERVALEYAKVRNLYNARLRIGDRTEIEWFVGPHTINGQGTFRFLHKHLNWPEKPAPAGKKPGEIGDNVKGAKGLEAALKNLHAPRVLSDPLPPSDAVKRLKVQPGLAVDLVLSEPTVRQPVFTTFDERGRLWVVQYLQYPFPAGLKVVEYDQYIRAKFDKVPPPPPRHFRGADKITIHESTRGDGTFDKSTVFAEGLNITTAALPGRGGVWVLNPPYLLFYPDKNRDDIPDADPQVHLSGFGLEDTHSVANSLIWGPDGWLYGANGSTCTAKVRVNISGSPKTTDFMGQVIWRYHPERHVFEIFAEGGGNTFGVEFDDQGRLYSGTNGDARGVYYVQGGYYRKAWGKHGPLTNPYALGFYDFMPHSGNRERFTHNFVEYGGDSLPEGLRGKIIAVNPLHKRVQVSRKEAVGSGYKTVEEPFLLTSSDGWFRPVDVRVGPDGALYVSDFYEARISHVDPRDNWDRSNGRIYRIRVGEYKPAGRFDLAKLSSEDLVGLLAHKNRWQRQTALRILGDRKDRSVVPLLRRNLDRHTGQLALESLWALYQCGGYDERTALRGLDHDDPFVRMWAVRLLGDDRRVSPALAASLATLAEGEIDPQVRSQLASSAKRLPASASLPILLNLIKHREDVNDPHIPLLIWWALEAKAESDRAAVMQLFRDPSVWKEPITERHLLDRLVQRYAMAGGKDNLGACATLLRLPSSPEEAKRLLSGLEQAFAGRGITNISDEFRGAIKHALSVAGRTPSALTLGLRLGLPEAVDEAFKLVGDDKARTEDRLRCIRILGEAPQPRCVPLLLGQLRTAPDTVCVEILTALQRYDDPAVGKAVLDLNPAGLPEQTGVRGAAFNLLASRPGWALDFVRAVDTGKIPPSAVPTDVVRKVNLHKNEQIAKLVRKHWGRLSPATSQEKQKEMLRLVKLVRGGKGDAGRGRVVFEQTCAKCHKLFGEGGVVGPDLTGYERDNLLFWVENIVDPSAAIREEYTTTLVETKDGRVLTGILAAQDKRSILLRDPEGNEVRLARENIEELRASPVSLMPEDQMRTLGEQQICDLFVYLMSKGPPER